MTPQPGDWALVREEQSPVEKMQRLIRGAQPRYAKWVHAFMLVSLDPVTIVEAMPHGMQRVPMHYPDSSLFWSDLVVRPAAGQRAAIVAAADGYAARRVGYGFLDYLAIADHSWGIPFPGLQAFIADSKRLICSQAVDQFCLDAGVHLFADGRWPGFAAPLHLAELIGAP